MTDIEYKNILTIYKDEYTFEYDRDSEFLYLYWVDEEGEEFSLLLYDTEWHLEECPIKDFDLLSHYLKTFKEYK
jgi:hypothetical protein